MTNIPVSVSRRKREGRRFSYDPFVRGVASRLLRDEQSGWCVPPWREGLRFFMYWVYVLFSVKLGKYYVGSSNNISDRLKRHNNKQSRYTKKGVPWDLVTSFECDSRPEAVRLEKKIKKRGIKRYLDDVDFSE